MKKAEKNAPALPGVVLLAAGLGKRMRSSLPKVMQEIAGKPLIFHVLSQIKEVNKNIPIALVVGYGREKVETYLKSEEALSDLDLTLIVQDEQKGTGHAARCAVESDWGRQRVTDGSSILVLPGDLPLLRPELIQKMLEPLKKQEKVRVLTCELLDPTGYGRIVRSSTTQEVIKIVEEKDASEKQKKIKEVGTSIYLFESQFLQSFVKKLAPNNAQGEYYLTDLILMASQSSKGSAWVTSVLWSEERDLRGVNDPWELSIAREIFNERLIQFWAKKGVQFLKSNTVHLDVEVALSENVVIYPGVVLTGRTEIAQGVTLGAHVVLSNVRVGEGSTIKTGTVAENAQVGSKVSIGPYAHLRPESNVGDRCKIGNFVELKKTQVQENTSIAHLSYLGDAQVGKNVNIGCGFVTCNYDGREIQGQRKHQTIIEDDVFLGSACQAVAPVRIGQGAYVGSGSTITENVEPHALAIARARQVNKPGYAEKIRAKRNKE